MFVQKLNLRSLVNEELLWNFPIFKNLILVPINSNCKFKYVYVIYTMYDLLMPNGILSSEIIEETVI